MHAGKEQRERERERERARELENIKQAPCLVQSLMQGLTWGSIS